MPDNDPNSAHPTEVLIEYVRIGNSVRVTAIDAVTGTEVVFQAPAASSQSDLQRTAVNKLNYVLRKKREH